MSILLRVEMRSERAERAEAKRDEHRATRRAGHKARGGYVWPWQAAALPLDDEDEEDESRTDER